MRRAALYGVVAIAALFAGAVLILDRLGGDTGPAAAPPRARAERAQQAEPPLPEQPPPPPAAVEAQPLPGGQPEPAPAPVPAAPPPSPQVVAAQVNTRIDLLGSLAKLKQSILECAGVTTATDEEGRASARAARKGAPRSKVVFALRLEPRDGEVMVLEAKEVVREGPNERLASCAFDELQGRKLEAGRTQPGPPFQMQYVVEEPGR